MPDFSFKLMTINIFFPESESRICYSLTGTSSFAKNKTTFSIRSSLLKSWVFLAAAFILLKQILAVVTAVVTLDKDVKMIKKNNYPLHALSIL